MKRIGSLMHSARARVARLNLPPGLHAWCDLIARYATAFRWAWQQRNDGRPAPGSKDESEFLPAALALQETPVSPAPRLAMWCLIIFAALVVVWAVFGQVDIVAVASGKVIPDDRSKIIQPLEAGVIHRIAVAEGQAVTAGQLLVELDSRVAVADTRRITDELLQARLQAARARALLAALDNGAAPAMVLWDLDAQSALLVDAQRMMRAEWADIESRFARLEAERSRRQAERESLTHIVHRLEGSLPLVRQRTEDYRRLLQDNFVSVHAYLEKEQVRIEQEGELATARSRLREVDAALREWQAQKAAFESETRRTLTAAISDGMQKQMALEQALEKAEVKTGLTELRSPVNGRIQQLAVTTVGGVVTPAQVLMVVVPDEAPLMVEAVLNNRDIGFVREGQDAQVKFETFLFTRYGTVAAVVHRVSGDAVTDEQRGLVFSVRLHLSQTTLHVDGRDVPITPGMAVSAEIRTGRRRVIEYFLSPLIQGLSESLRER